MRASLRFVLPVLAVLVAAGAARRGGWAVITVDDLPDSVVAGTPLELSFVVRQHGRELLEDLRPVVSTVVSGKQVHVPARAAGAGRYIAKLELPQPGDAPIRIESGFNGSRVDLLPLAVVAAGAKAPQPTPYERGRRLFVAKGCQVCHQHQDASTERSMPIGPALTGHRFPVDYLTQVLKDPRRTLRTQGPWTMPDLGLRDREIAALVAFLNDVR